MPKTRHVGTLNRGLIMPAKAARNFWCVTPVEGAKALDLCQPEYWKHVVMEVGLQPNDRVEATCQDGSWWAEYLVIHTGPHSAKLQLLREVSLEEVTDDELETETHFVKWISPSNKYGVRRKSDNEIMKDGFLTKSLASIWMLQNLSKIAA